MRLHEALDEVVDAATARREIEKHSASWEDFVADHGDAPEYEGSVVLGWLGW